MREKAWVTIEITPRGEEEARAGRLRSLLAGRSSIDEEDIYVPIIRSGKDPIFLLEGYIFIRTGYPTSEYVHLKRTPWVSGLLAKIDPRTGLISSGVVKDKDLKAMIKRADNMGGKFQIGDDVEIKSGDMKGFSAKVMDWWMSEDGLRNYTLLIEMRSVEVILSVDCLSLEG